MKDIYALDDLKNLIQEIKENPLNDYDDALFNTFLNYADLGKVLNLRNKIIRDNNKVYLSLTLDVDKEKRLISFYSLFKGFDFDFSSYDGFVLDGVSFEKGFIEEICSSLDTSSLCIKKGDITTFDGDAIVNAANSYLVGGSGVDGAIHKKAGKGLDKECRSIAWCDTGKAVITGAYNLSVDYIIHTVGPIYKGKKEDTKLLKSCYASSLTLAKENGIKSIAFPIISSGAYGYPFLDAFLIARDSINDFLDENVEYPMSVFLYVYSEEDFNKILTLD